MKIVHADTDDLGNPLRGGQPVRTFEINRRLAKQHEVNVLTAVFPNAKRKYVRDGVLYKRLGIHIKPFGLSPHLTYLSSIGPRLRTIPHDIVIEEFMPPFGFSLLPFWTRKPVVSVIQWFFFDYWEKKYHLPFKKIMEAIAGWKKYQYFIVQTHAMGKRIKRLVPHAIIQKIPCGINQESFLAPKNTGTFVFFMGRLDIHQKGLDMLLEAWFKVCAKKNIPLVIAGEGPDRKKLENLVQYQGLKSLITFAGRVEGKEKNRLLGECRLMAMPSREETFGISALEAMAAKKPVVAFNIESLNELIRPDYGTLVNAMDSVMYGNEIYKLWSNPRRCKQMGMAAGIQAEKYLWDRLADQQNLFYHQITAQERT